MKNENNIAKIAGDVVTMPQSYDCGGEKFYAFYLSVKRWSDAEDIIPVNMPVILCKDLHVGDKICLIGQIRTYNKMIDNKSRLLVLFFAMDKEDYTDYVNSVELTGFFCRPPVIRRTPLGRDICDVQIAVNRERQKSDYIPLITWGRKAQIAAQLNVGACVYIKGRLQSRVYHKLTEQGTIEKKIAYEVSVSSISEKEKE